MEPRREDVESIDGIIRAMYEVISGPAGPRDWDRERTLFLPGARLVPTRPNPEGGATADVFDVEGYVASRSPFFAANDFWEVEVGRKVDRFGNIAQVWSVYEGRRAQDAEPFMRGINSIQLFHDGSRWWVVSILWDNEREGNPLPEAYLRGGSVEPGPAGRGYPQDALRGTVEIHGDVMEPVLPPEAWDAVRGDLP